MLDRRKYSEILANFSNEQFVQEFNGTADVLDAAAAFLTIEGPENPDYDRVATVYDTAFEARGMQENELALREEIASWGL